MMKDRDIKRLLQRAPDIAPPQGLYEAIRNNLDIQAPERQSSFFRRPVLGIPYFATVMLLMIAGTALAGVVANMIRWESWRDVPVERRSGVNEPVVNYPEDVAPLAPEVVNWLRGLADLVDQRNGAGEKWLDDSPEVLPDGSTITYTREPAERTFGKNLEIHTFYSTFHPNDNRLFWMYNDDGSPILIKNVKALHNDHVTTTGVCGMTSDPPSRNQNVNYEFELEHPRSKSIWKKCNDKGFWGKNPFIDVQKLDESHWRARYLTNSDNHDHYCVEIRLPAGAQVGEQKPAGRVRIDESNHPIVTFEGKLVNGGTPSLEVTYHLPEDQSAASPGAQ